MIEIEQWNYPTLPFVWLQCASRLAALSSNAGAHPRQEPSGPDCKTHWTSGNAQD
ncbi:MAG: hypothetical protein ACHP7A_04130 [Caulobacterales bacterium]|jgi:hypothetical protein